MWAPLVRGKEKEKRKQGWAAAAAGGGRAGLVPRQRRARAPGWLGRTRPLGPVGHFFSSFLFSFFSFLILL
jgi:hypothetical protein